MALDFPASPSVNDTYTSGGRTWRWNGTAWVGATPYSGQATITGGTINNTPIGGTTRAAGAFTTVDANSNILSSGGVVGYSSGTTVYTIGSGGYNGPVGGSTPAAGSFTTLTVNGNLVTVNGATTLNDWFNQSVKTTAAVTFASLSTGSGAISGGAISGTTGTFTGVVQLGTGGSSKIATIGDATVGGDAQLRLRPNPAELGWSLGASTLVANSFTITPSTAAGGTTFSTPVATFTSTGLAVTGNLIATGGIAGFAGGAYVQGLAYPVSGAGLEFGYYSAGNYSQIQSYDRTGSAWKGIDYNASAHTFNVSGSPIATISSTGLAVTGAHTVQGTGSTGTQNAVPKRVTFSKTTGLSDTANLSLTMDFTFDTCYEWHIGFVRVNAGHITSYSANPGAVEELIRFNVFTSSPGVGTITVIKTDASGTAITLTYSAPAFNVLRVTANVNDTSVPGTYPLHEIWLSCEMIVSVGVTPS